MLKPIAPEGKIILIEKKEVEKTKSGIVLPENSKKPHSRFGKIVSVGANCGDLKEGDYISWEIHKGDGLEINDQLHIVIRHDSVLAKLVEVENANPEG